MTVKVTDLEKSLEISKEFDAVIGLLDKRQKQWMERGLGKIPNRKMFWFDDVPEGYNDGPERKDIDEIIAHVKEKDLLNPEKKVLVHCFAGISRSTATAISLLVMRGWKIDSAINHIHIQRPHMWPNELVLKHFDDALDLKGELTKAVEKWKSITLNSQRDPWM